MRVFSGGDPMATCKVGVDIHFKPKDRQISKTVAALRRFKRDANGSKITVTKTVTYTYSVTYTIRYEIPE